MLLTWFTYILTNWTKYNQIWHKIKANKNIVVNHNFTWSVEEEDIENDTQLLKYFLTHMAQVLGYESGEALVLEHQGVDWEEFTFIWNWVNKLTACNNSSSNGTWLYVFKAETHFTQILI